MKKVFTVAAVAGAVGALSFAGSVGAASGPHASGGGKWAGGQCNFGFAANQNGATPVGTMNLTKCFNGFQIHAKVTCLRVEGNEAVIGGVVTKSTLPALPPGSGLEFFVQDNGEPGAGTDEFFALGRPNGPPEECSPPGDTFPPSNGNVTVHE